VLIHSSPGHLIHHRRPPLYLFSPRHNSTPHLQPSNALHRAPSRFTLACSPALLLCVSTPVSLLLCHPSILFPLFFDPLCASRHSTLLNDYRSVATCVHVATRPQVRKSLSVIRIRRLIDSPAFKPQCARRPLALSPPSNPAFCTQALFHQLHAFYSNYSTTHSRAAYANLPRISTKPYCPSSTPVLLGRRHHIPCKPQAQQRALPLFIKSRARFLLPIPQRTLMAAKDNYSVPFGASPSLWLPSCAFPSHSLSLSSHRLIYVPSSLPCWCDNLGSLSCNTILTPLTILYSSRWSPNSCAANI
jgi:hypothetical protein